LQAFATTYAEKRKFRLNVTFHFHQSTSIQFDN